MSTRLAGTSIPVVTNNQTMGYKEMSQLDFNKAMEDKSVEEIMKAMQERNK